MYEKKTRSSVEDLCFTKPLKVDPVSIQSGRYQIQNICSYRRTDNKFLMAKMKRSQCRICRSRWYISLRQFTAAVLESWESTFSERNEFGGMAPFIGLIVKTDSWPLYQASTLWTVNTAGTGETLVTICSNSDDVRFNTSPNSTTGRLRTRKVYLPIPNSLTCPLVFVVVPTFACKVWCSLQLVNFSFRVV